ARCARSPSGRSRTVSPCGPSLAATPSGTQATCARARVDELLRQARPRRAWRGRRARLDLLDFLQRLILRLRVLGRLLQCLERARAVSEACADRAQIEPRAPRIAKGERFLEGRGGPRKVLAIVGDAAQRLVHVR